MRPTLKAAVAGVLTVAIAGGGLLALAGAAFAASAPPWEPDGNAAAPYGNITFYDASGNQVTSGTGDLTNPFAYIVGSTPSDGPAVNAVANFYNPKNGVAPANWTGTSEGSSFDFASPPAGTPADLVAFASDYPVASTMANITNWLASNTPDTTAGYANTIQVRLTDAPGEAVGTYWESDIGYNTTSSSITVDGTTVPADGWAQLFPFVTPTTTGLATSATGGDLQAGNDITLTAAVATGDAGTVQFYDGTTSLGDVSVNTATGEATYPSTGTYVPPTGSHSYTASFIPGIPPGDETGPGTANATILGGSTSSPVVVSVTPALTGTTTTLSASSLSVAAGASDIFTATVGATDNSTTGVTGSVEFLYGTTAITGCTAQATTVTGAGTSGSPGVGTATCTTSALPAGSNSITAVFTPTSNSYANSTSSVVMVTVAQTGTTTSLSASSPSLAAGASDIFTATVGATDDSTTGVTGSVEFLDGTTTIMDCSAQATTVTGAGTSGSPGVGTAICTTNSLLEGSNSLTAVFTPTSNSYAASTSSAVMVTAAQTGTTPSLSAGPASIAYGASDVLTATVGATDDSTTGVTGSVEFLDGTTPITGCTAQATTVTGAGTSGSPGVGKATCTTSALPAGSNSVTAVFTPTSNTYATSTSSAVGVTVGEASSTLAFKLSSTWVIYGDEEAAVASVKVSPQFAGSTPAGTVTVSESGSTLCVITLSGAKGSCALSATQLAVGSYYSLTANYPGNTDFSGSSSSVTGSLTVAPASTTTSLSISAAKVVYGDEGGVKLTVRVKPEFSGPTPAGSVMVSDSSTTLCAITYSGAVDSCTLSARSIPAGSYNLVATYSGSADFESSASANERLTVSKETSKVALKLSSSKVTFGHETSEHISVDVSPEFTGSMPGGKVTVVISSRTLCVISLSSGKGSCTLSAKKLSVGTYGLVASYSGSSDFGASASTKETLKVVK